MDKGKATCKILKEIRKQIAKENDIAFVTSECKYQGDCLGTCPACEAEVRYLEEELRKRKQLGKAVIVTGVSLGLATTFLGCHFGGNAEDTATNSVSSSPARQESELSAAPIPEKEPTSPSPQKATRSNKQLSMTTEGIVLDISDSSSAGPVNKQPISSDTIDIIYEMPEFEPNGDIVPIPRITLLENYKGACLQPSVEPVFLAGEDSCRKFIQQHIHISPKLAQYLRGKFIYFAFIVDEKGHIGKVDAECYSDNKALNRWAKRCERAAKKSIKSMPRWAPGKDQNLQPIPCIKRGFIIVGEPNQVWFDY